VLDNILHDDDDDCRRRRTRYAGLAGGIVILGIGISSSSGRLPRLMELSAGMEVAKQGTSVASTWKGPDIIFIDMPTSYSTGQR